MDDITHDLAFALRELDPSNYRLAAYDAIMALVEGQPIVIDWRELAKRDELIPAIKALRHSEGLSLYAAKMVVKYFIAKSKKVSAGE